MDIGYADLDRGTLLHVCHDPKTSSNHFWTSLSTLNQTHCKSSGFPDNPQLRRVNLDINFIHRIGTDRHLNNLTSSNEYNGDKAEPA